MKAPSLEEIVRQHIRLNPRPNSRGFFSVLCKVCNDHGKKGDRAGFKFTGKSVGYNCFNCGHSAVFDPNKHETMPRDMEVVLHSFGIERVDWEPALYDAMLYRQEGGGPSEVRINLEPDEQKMPTDFYPLTDDPDDVWAQEAIYYLTSRHVKWQDHPFHLVKKSNSPTNKLWYGRLIIPIYKGSKLVFWQGRDLTGALGKSYLSPPIAKDNIVGGYDRIIQYTDEPLYITEGWFDAYHVKGVSTFGNKLTPAQIKIINQSSRKKVVIPDKFGDGHLLAQQAVDLGWSVSFPDIGSCKDINAAVLKYGELYTKMTIRERTCDGFIAASQIGIYCERNPKPSTKTDSKVHRKAR